MKNTSIVMRTYCDLEHEWDYPQFAGVRITPAKRKQIRCRIDLFLANKKKDKETASLHFWDGDVSFFDKIPDTFEAPNDEYCTMPFPGEPARMECLKLVVSQLGIYWQGIPKHCNYYVTTATLPFSLFKQLPRKTK